MIAFRFSILTLTLRMEIPVDAGTRRPAMDLWLQQDEVAGMEVPPR